MPKETILSPMIRVRGSLEMGEFSIVDDFCYFSANVRIGAYVHIAHGVTILGGGFLCVIGDFTAVGPGVRIVCASDDYRGGIAGPRIPPSFKGHPMSGDVQIGRHCVVGANSVILPGVTLPDGAAIGALSLVRPKDQLEPYGLYAGCPLRHLGRRQTNEKLEEAFWQWAGR